MTMTYARVALAAAAVMLACTQPVAAQEAVAEIQTWRGAVVKLTQPSLEVLYTIIPAPLVTQTSGTTTAVSGGMTQGLTGASSKGPVSGTAVGTGPQPIQGRRDTTALTFVTQGIELHVPLDRIATLAVERRTIGSTLPAHVSPTHAQYSASATLTDGSKIDGAQVNFGTTILRGMGPYGTIELPLEDIKTLRITR